MDELPQSRGEEIANSISHGLGALAVLTGAPFLIIAASKTGSPWTIVGASVFLFAMFVLYTSSTLLHGLSFTSVKKVFRVLDHGAIFLLIAGTYTPFTLGALRGPWGWALFGVIWGLAILGITLKATDMLWHRKWSNFIYLVMSWLIVIAVWPMWKYESHAVLAWLLGGGIAYSGGVYFYSVQQKRFSHLLWHLLVLAGSACHYFAVLWAVR
jgi:hemolysin III